MSMSFDLSHSSSNNATNLLNDVLNGGGLGDAFAPPLKKARKNSNKRADESKKSRDVKKGKDDVKKHSSHKQHHATRNAENQDEKKRSRHTTDKKKRSSSDKTEALKSVKVAATTSKSIKARKQKAKQAIVSSNLLHFPMLCTNCGGCSVDRCSCNAPFVNVNDGSSQCDKNTILSSIYGFVFLAAVPTPIPFLVNWNADNNLVLTPNTAGGFVLADIDTAFGFNRTFSTTQRRVTRVGDTVAIANMADATLNTFYIVEEINATGYVLRPLRFSHRSCIRPKVNDVWRIRYGASKSMYIITSLTDCTDLWTFVPTLNASITNYELVHVACKLVDLDNC